MCRNRLKFAQIFSTKETQTKATGENLLTFFQQKQLNHLCKRKTAKTTKATKFKHRTTEILSKFENYKKLNIKSYQNGKTPREKLKFDSKSVLFFQIVKNSLKKHYY